MADDNSIELGLDVAGHPGLKESSISLEVVASADLDLAGLKLAVDKARLSLSLAVAFGDHGPALTPTFALKPPEGASAELDLPGFSGGGYLAKHGDEWQGAISASLGPVSVSGFGILTTDEFSILILLAAEFTPPIQLSFGFTLVGVGGLVGINRRPDTDALRAAASSGDLSNLLFPHDPVADAPHLLPVLSSCFPHSPGDLVVGPMLKLGWGTPTIVAATLAVLVSNDGVVIVGRLAITLPFEQAAIIRLEALVLVTIDADGLALDATLSNSQIVGLPVEGDIKVRIRGGDNALFAFSAGGFHPAFTPPEGMGGMKRIGTELSPGPFLRARFGAYLAVTTNSVQFGAHAELQAGIDGFGIKGHFDFDALIVFDPFGFQVDFSAGVSIECADFDIGSIELDGHLSGTSPWRIRGHAEVDILFFSVGVDIPEITFGSPDAAALPPARDPLGVLVHELGVPANWTATSREVPHVVRLRPGVAEDHAAMHPMAEVAFRQTAVPLDIDLQRMDGVPLPVATTLGVAAPEGQPELRMQQDQFPPSQFRTQDDKAKLSSAGYARFDAGFDLDPQGGTSGDAPQGRDDVHPEIAVLAEDFFIPKRVCELAAGVMTMAGHSMVPKEVHQPFVTVRDPGVTVIASVDQLRDATATLTEAYAGSGDPALVAAATGLSLAGQHAGVASELIAGLAAQDATTAAGLQVARAWEVG
ncbi:DUF6603 domain-containing protein [Marmoricola sp. URHB0036]|uniref:DUF6603 domain-containing protein n=1 Tax=Marmoricola sp. URHB0036 TaxID=1298863 RepID=UPI0004269EA6|nr:DUF6603 domain-containing protein [Marmoricola sp. URHB0036]